jgi:hypothetical protein
LAQLRGHCVEIIFVQIEFLGDLLVRQVEPYQIQTQNPLAQGLAMTSKDRPDKIIKVAVTRMAMIALAVALLFIAASFDDRSRVAPDTMEAVRPAPLADGFVTLGIVNEVSDLQHKRRMLGEDQFFKELGEIFHDLPDSAIEHSLNINTAELLPVYIRRRSSAFLLTTQK